MSGLLNYLKIDAAEQAKLDATVNAEALKDLREEEGVKPLTEPLSEPLREEKPIEDIETPSFRVETPEHMAGLVDSFCDDFTEAEIQNYELLPKADWIQLVQQGFNIGGAVTQLQTLMAVSIEDAGTREAFSALYDTLYDIPMMHFMLRPGGKWGGRIIAIACFTIPLSQGVKAEIREKHALKLQQQAEQQEEQQEEEQSNDSVKVAVSFSNDEPESANRLDFGNFKRENIGA